MQELLQYGLLPCRTKVEEIDKDFLIHHDHLVILAGTEILIPWGPECSCLYIEKDLRRGEIEKEMGLFRASLHLGGDEPKSLLIHLEGEREL